MSIPGSVNPLFLGAAGQATAPTGYQIERSVRFNSPDSAYLSRTPASAGNRKTWTWAGWVKRANLTSDRYFLFGCGPDGNDFFAVELGTGGDADKLLIQDYPQQKFIVTSQIFRDPSAWYHIVVAVDTTQATNTDRIKIYVNGSRITAFSTYDTWTQNMDTRMNRAQPTAIGDLCPGFGKTFSGYLADVHFIDGQALDPSSFGEFDTNGVWQPKAFSGGSYGTNGFRLPFSDNSTAAALGTDTSGNGNTWTVNNISVTAGAGNDSLVDSPTNYGTDDGLGGSVRGNYCTWNPLAKGANVSLSNGNLDASTSTTSGYGTVLGTVGMSSGKWYWEFTGGTGTLGVGLGIAEGSKNLATYLGTDVGYEYYSENGNKYSSAGGAAYGSSWGSGDVIGVTFDADAGTLSFYKNGVSQGTAYTGLTNTPYFPAVADSSGTNVLNGFVNFGQRPFAYTAPSGFKALCTANLPEPVVAKPSTFFNAIAYAGNSSTNTLPLEFGADLIWVKNRGITANHYIADVVRGTDKILASNNNEAESTNSGFISSISGTGVTLGSGSFVANYNQSGNSYVGWCWDAGSSTVTNTEGSITSSVRANASAGFSVVTYTGNNTANATFGHGLVVTPEFVIIKKRSSTGNWIVYHKGMTSAAYYMYLNATDAQTNQGGAVNTWGVSSTLITLKELFGDYNASGATYVSYCFAPVAGYSAMGSYVGNGSSDGVFVYTGFRSRWVMIKSTGSDDRWTIQDTSRSSYNASTDTLAPNLSNVELANAFNLDINSNGFKVRSTNSGHNTSSVTYIYYAVAENPFQYARAR